MVDLLWIAAAVVIVVVLYLYIGRDKAGHSSGDFDAADANVWASGEFKRTFPDDKVSKVIGDRELETFFMRLEDGRVGIYRSKRGKRKAQIVKQGEYRLRALPAAEGVQVDFPDNDFFSGNYHFTTEKDAADVSTWLLNAR